MDRQTSWTQRSVAAVTGVALATSLMLMPVLQAAGTGATDTPPTMPSASVSAAPTKGGAMIDPRWQALIDTVESQEGNRQIEQVAAFNPIVHINLADGSFFGRVTTAEPVSIQLSRASYPYYSPYFIVQPVFDGTSHYFIAQFGGNLGLTEGDLITLTQGSASVGLTLPPLTATINAATNVITGSTIASTTVNIRVLPFEQPDIAITQTVTSAANGGFAANLSAARDVRPRDEGYVWIKQASRHYFYDHVIAPFVRAEVGGYFVYGKTSPNTWANLVLLDAAGAYRNSGSNYAATGNGIFAIQIYSTTRPTDQWVASFESQVITLSLPTLSAQFNSTKTAIIGQAPPNTTVSVWRFHGPVGYEGSVDLGLADPTITGTSTAQGNYSINLDIDHEDYFHIAVQSADGHEVFTRLNNDYLKVYLRAPDLIYNGYNPLYQVSGQLNQFNQLITTTIQGPSGYLKNVRSINTNFVGAFLDYGQNSYYDTGATVLLGVGDVLTFSSQTGNITTIQIPDFNVGSEGTTGMIWGNAPANATILLHFFNYSTPNPPGPIPTVIPIGTPAPAATWTPAGIPLATITPVPTTVPRHSVLQAAGGGPGVPIYGSELVFTVTVGANGDFSADLSKQIDLRYGFQGEAELLLSNGHSIVRPLIPNTCRPTVAAVYLGRSYVQLNDAQCSTERFSLTLYSASGAVKLARTNLSSGLVDLITLNTPNPQQVFIEAGDQIEIVKSNFSSRFVVPNLTVQMDKQANRVQGSASPNQEITLQIIENRTRFGFITPATGYYTTTQSNAQGAYSLTLGSAFTLTSGTIAEASFILSGTRVSAFNILPYLNINIGAFYVSGALGVATPYDLQIVSPTLPIHPVLSQTVTNSDGAIGNAFDRLILPGDRVILNSQPLKVDLVIPNLFGQVDRSTGILQGSGPANAKLKLYWVAFFDPWGSAKFEKIMEITTNAQGQYSAVIPPKLLADQPYLLLYLIYEPVDGVQILRQFDSVRTRWVVDLPHSRVSGSLSVDVTTRPTLNLRNSAGQLKEAAGQSLNWANGGFTAVFSKTIVSGDILELTLSGKVVTYTVPPIQISYLGKQGALVGRVGPNMQVDVNLQRIVGSSPYYNSARRVVRSNSSGAFGVDINDIRPTLGSLITFALMDTDGNVVYSEIKAVAATVSMPIVMRH